jgi:hypothetical protein
MGQRGTVVLLVHRQQEISGEQLDEYPTIIVKARNQ